MSVSYHPIASENIRGARNKLIGAVRLSITSLSRVIGRRTGFTRDRTSWSLHTKRRVNPPVCRTDLITHTQRTAYRLLKAYIFQLPIKPTQVRCRVLEMSNSVVSPVPGVEILGPVSSEAKTILTNDAVTFLASLHRNFNATRKHLLKRRQLRQQQIDAGFMLDFLPETKHIRDDDTWRAAKPAPGLEDRRVEITGPVDRKMVPYLVRTVADGRLSML